MKRKIKLKLMKLFFTALMVLNGLFSLSSYAATIWYPMPQEAYSFSKMFPEAQSLLFGFDYGHALLYEKLIIAQGIPKGNGPDAAPVDFHRMEEETLTQVFQILHNPPKRKPEEEDIAPQYVYYFSWLSNIFDWSHLLHQFVFDLFTDYPGQMQKIDGRIDELVQTYQSKPRVAIPMACRTMDLMDGQYYSKIFRQVMPKYNQLIWSYHWFQMKLYDDMMLGTTEEQRAAVEKSIAQFWNKVSNLPDSSGFDMMPMASEVAPEFFKRYPKVSWSFDANHMTHDIINDILVSPLVSAQSKSQEGLRAAQIVLDKSVFSCEATGDNPTITIEGKSDGSCMPEMIHLSKGKQIKLALKSEEGMFMFTAKDLGLELMSMPGQPATSVFTPTQEGTFLFTCGKDGASEEQLTHGKIMVMEGLSSNPNHTP
jgi:heme/copper-type cytochrome/quinol oxidase subunit 2